MGLEKELDRLKDPVGCPTPDCQSNLYRHLDKQAEYMAQGIKLFADQQAAGNRFLANIESKLEEIVVIRTEHRTAVKNYGELKNRVDTMAKEIFPEIAKRMPRKEFYIVVGLIQAAALAIVAIIINNMFNALMKVVMR